jgi:2-amino-4-hydroxy-6-hydroxymethyldihydropteridine diphosphokinase
MRSRFLLDSAQQLHFVHLCHPLNDRAMQPDFIKKYINVFLGLGSNMGDRAANLRAATNLIVNKIGKVAKKSHIYETQPWGNTEQEPFLNQIIMVNTMLDPRNLLDKISSIERELGRERRRDKEKWGPRTIDIDILFYGKRVVRDKGLEIPHPELHKRAFVLVPLMEIAPDLEHPILKKQIDELYMNCGDDSDVVMLD